MTPFFLNDATVSSLTLQVHILEIVQNYFKSNYVCASWWTHKFWPTLCNFTPQTNSKEICFGVFHNSFYFDFVPTRILYGTLPYVNENITYNTNLHFESNRASVVKHAIPQNEQPPLKKARRGDNNKNPHNNMKTIPINRTLLILSIATRFIYRNCLFPVSSIMDLLRLRSRFENTPLIIYKIINPQIYINLLNFIR